MGLVSDERERDLRRARNIIESGLRSGDQSRIQLGAELLGDALCQCVYCGTSTGKIVGPPNARGLVLKCGCKATGGGGPVIVIVADNKIPADVVARVIRERTN